MHIVTRGAGGWKSWSRAANFTFHLQILILVIFSAAELKTFAHFFSFSHFTKKCQTDFPGGEDVLSPERHSLKRTSALALTRSAPPKHSGKFFMSPKCLKYGVSILYRHLNELREFWSFKEGHLARCGLFDARSLASIWAFFGILVCLLKPCASASLQGA